MTPSPDSKTVEAVARAMRELMGPLFGSPEYLADPVKLARAEKRQADAAFRQAQAAIRTLQEMGWRCVGEDEVVAPSPKPYPLNPRRRCDDRSD